MLAQPIDSFLMEKFSINFNLTQIKYKQKEKNLIYIIKRKKKYV